MRALILLLAAVAAGSPSASAQKGTPCAQARASAAPVKPRSLAGVFTLEWRPGPGPWRREVRRERLWLWPTSSRDSSPVRGGIHAAPGDTAEYPLFGTVTPETVSLAKADSVRDDTDRIYPPVLLLARADGENRPGSPSLVLLVRTVANRDPTILINDGAGYAVHLDRVGPNAFSGPYSPWGIAFVDSGSACVTRLR